jgi:hypothetical protein
MATGTRTARMAASFSVRLLGSGDVGAARNGRPDMRLSGQWRGRGRGERKEAPEAKLREETGLGVRERLKVEAKISMPPVTAQAEVTVRLQAGSIMGVPLSLFHRELALPGRLDGCRLAKVVDTPTQVQIATLAMQPAPMHQCLYISEVLNFSFKFVRRWDVQFNLDPEPQEDAREVLWHVLYGFDSLVKASRLFVVLQCLTKLC